MTLSQRLRRDTNRTTDFILRLFSLGRGDNRTVLVTCGAVAIGALFWLWFLKWGVQSFGTQDWQKDYRYMALIHEALHAWRIPLHMSSYIIQTDRFFALPEARLWPHVLLLAVVPVKPFMTLDILLFYFIGAAGCLKLASRYRLATGTFVCFFVLFIANGYVTSHLAVGHTMWSNYFLFPWLLDGVADVIDGRPVRVIVLKLGLWLFALQLEGGVHHFVQWTYFLVLLAISIPEQALPILASLALAFGLSSFRLVPSLLTYWGQGYPFIGGFQSLQDFIAAFARLRDSKHPKILDLSWWEFDYYVGLGATLILLLVGLLPLLRDDPAGRLRGWTRARLPIFALTFLSFANYHAVIATLPLPLANSERVTSRMVVIPFVTVLFVAAIRGDELLRKLRAPLARAGVLVLLLGLIAHPLWRHARAWSVWRMERIWPRVVPEPLHIANHSDPAYVLALVVGVIISLTTAAAAVWWLGSRAGTTAELGGA